MSTNVKEAIATWNKEHATATAELEALEAPLKTDYNRYIDSLAAYIARVKAANDVRQGYVGIFQIEDVLNGTRTQGIFEYSAKAPIQSNASKYLLDNDVNGRVTTSLILTSSCSADGLLERKVD